MPLEGDDMSRLRNIVALLLVLPPLLGGCSTVGSSSEMVPDDMRSAKFSSDTLAASPAASSLFPGDQLVLTDQQIDKIFATRIAVPDSAKLSVVRYGGWPMRFWSEEFARLDQQSMEEFLGKLRAVKRLSTVQVMPEMLLPRQMDIPHLREAAARVQADLLLIYRPGSRSYQKSRFLKKDATRAYCTVEGAVLDTRSGVVVYTTRASEDFAAEQSTRDMSFEETVGRAEQQAVGRAMARIGDDVATFLSADSNR
jgi:hypothetical protein